MSTYDDNLVIHRHEAIERFRERLEKVIDKSGLSRAAFARKIGIDRSTLAQILSPATDRLPRVETLVAIAASEQVSVDWLVGLSEQGRLGVEIMQETPADDAGSGLSPTDEHVVQWHAETLGAKIRHVPRSLPDLLKTESVIDYEYQRAAIVTPEQRRTSSQVSLELQRRPETDMECVCSIQALTEFALGEGIWRELPALLRRDQLETIVQLCDELYPTFRWFLIDARSRFSVPMWIFGSKRAVIYVGQRYLIINSRDHIRTLAEHFDDLIRGAIVQPHEVSRLVTQLLRDVAPPRARRAR